MNKLAAAQEVRSNLDKTGQPRKLKPSLLAIAVAAALSVNASSGLAQNIEIESSLGGSVTGERVNNTTNLFADGISDSGSTILLDANDDVSSNRISNSAILDAFAEGIELYAENGEVEANTVNNSGRILAGDDGILVRSDESALRANTIENSGLIEAGDDGIDLMSEGDLSGNDVINRGRIVAGDNGIEIGIEFPQPGVVFGNDVTNSGSIVAEDDGIQIEGGNGV